MFLVPILVIFWGCTSLSKPTWEALETKEDYILYRKSKLQVDLTLTPFDKETYRLIFGNFFTRGRIFSEKRFIFQSSFINQFINSIPIHEFEQFDFLLIQKKSDNVFPATRMERIALYFGYTKEGLFIHWQEIERPLLFLTPYSDRDWQNLEIYEVPCAESQKIWLEDEIGFLVKFEEEQKCNSPKGSKINYNKMNIRKGNFLPNFKGRTMEERLNELETLYKKKLISKQEYDSIRKKLLNEL